MNTDNLVELRKYLGITQVEMSEFLNVSRPTYTRYENGTIIIPLVKLNLISNKYNASLDYLTGLSRKNNTNFNHINDINKKIIGQRLNEVRIKNKFTQEEVAKRLNTVHSCISDYENGKTMIPTIFLVGFAKITNTSLDYLCGKID